MKWTTHSLCFKVWNFSLFALYHSFAAKAEQKWNWRLCKSYRMLVWCSVHVERLATCPTRSNHNSSQRDSANECVLMCVNVNIYMLNIYVVVSRWHLEESSCSGLRGIHLWFTKHVCKTLCCTAGEKPTCGEQLSSPKVQIMKLHRIYILSSF